MRKTALALLGGMAFALVGFATPAAGCVVVPVTCVGDNCPRTPAQHRAFERYWSANLTSYRYSQARIRLRAGNVDFAAELAEMLVPNVRAVWAEETDCGLDGEIDYAEDRETDAALFQRIVSGTSLGGSDFDSFADFFRAERGLAFGEGCNAEFRRGFAVYLRQSVELDDLRDSWLFLVARRRDLENGHLYRRLLRFEGTARTPPIHWQAADEWLSARVQRYVQSEPPGRELAAAIAAFWADRAGQISDDAQVCPIFSAEWVRQREEVVSRMIEWEASRRGN